MLMDFLFSLLPGELTSQLGIIFTMLTLLFYFAECFFGYRMIRSWISILGFLLGAIGSFNLCTLFFDQTGYILAGSIIGGLLLCGLSYKVYLAGVFLIAAYNVFQIGLTLLPLESLLLPLVSAALGILAGYIAVKNMRPAIIAVTAFHGGIMAAGSLPFFLALPTEGSLVTYGLIIGILGTVFQFFNSKK